MHKKQVLIVGGGFGGIKAALELEADKDFEITLLSDRPAFRYYPTLYHTATGGLPAQSSIPLDKILEGKDIKLVEAVAKSIDRKAHTLTAIDGKVFKYDVVVLALGVVTNYFGIKGLLEYSYGVKSLEDAVKLKAHLHKQLTSKHKPDLNYVVVGGGPTGIELAGALPHYIKQIMGNHDIEQRTINIDLIDTVPHLLPRMPKSMGRKVERHLRSLGVKLYLGKNVMGETADSLNVGGEPINSQTVIWTAGVTNNPFFSENGFAISDHGKVVVDGYLQAGQDVYVIGDNADTQYSGMAQTALYDAIFASKIIKRKQAGKDSRAYMPKKPIYVIPAGPRWAAVLWGKLQLNGRLGWWLRESADAAAFHDLEPWWKAGKQWLTEFATDEDCPECSSANSYKLKSR